MRRLLAIATLLVLTGCGGTPLPPPSPDTGGPGLSATTPEPTATAAPSYSPYNPKLAADEPRAGISDAGIKLLGGSLTIEATDGSGPIAKAIVDVLGPTLATGVTDEHGKVSLGPLEPGAGYTVVVRAPGFAPSFASVRQGGLEIKQKMTTSVRLALVGGTSVAGRVLAGGKPVGGAVVSDGLNSALTDDKGQYLLTGVGLGSVNLRASKPGLKAGVRAISLAGSRTDGIDLELAASSGAVFFDTRLTQGFDPGRFDTLKQAIAGQGWKLVDAPPPSPGDVWVMVCPARPPSSDTIAQATAFAAQGGKLVLLGEWGGFSGFDTLGANALAHGLGLHFNPDAVREFTNGHTSEGLTIAKFEPLVFGTDGPATVRLSNACSLFGVSTMRALATTGPKAYHVQGGEFDTRLVAVGGPFGAGKAIAVGDTSAFSDDDVNGDGTPDAKDADNMRFWAKLLAW